MALYQRAVHFNVETGKQRGGNGYLPLTYQDMAALPNLRELTLYTENLQTIPAAPQPTEDLEELCLDMCRQLQVLPVWIVSLRELTRLDLIFCDALTDLSPIGHLRSLEQLDIRVAAALQELPGNLRSLRYLKTINLDHIPQLTCLPNLPYVERLDISDCTAFTGMPENSMPLLEGLGLKDCPGLVALPLMQARELKYLTVTRCGLQQVSGAESRMDSLQEVTLIDCPHLVEIPAMGIATAVRWTLYDLPLLRTLPYFPNVSELTLDNLTGLVSLPPSLNDCTRLMNLNIIDCPALTALPAVMPGGFPALRNLTLRGLDGFLGLPASLGNLPGLRSLSLTDCPLLARLPDSIGKLRYLVTLLVNDCDLLTQLPAALGKLAPHLKGIITNDMALKQQYHHLCRLQGFHVRDFNLVPALHLELWAVMLSRERRSQPGPQGASALPDLPDEIVLSEILSCWMPYTPTF